MRYFSEIRYEKFEMQPYLQPGNDLNMCQMRKILKLRIRDVQEIKGNCPKEYSSLECPMPSCHEYMTQKHVFYCTAISNQNEIISESITYEDLFRNDVKKQIQVMNVMYSRLKKIREYLEEENYQGRPRIQ